MPNVLDIEQSLLLLELEPPFDKRDVQLARRRMAKIWHPDIAPPGKQFEHERHLKAINEAADQLESLAEGSRGGRVSRNAVKVSAAAARAARAEEGRRAYEEEQRRRAADADNLAVLRLMPLAFWQAGNLNAAARSVRDWARRDPERPAPQRFAARIYEDMGAIDLAAEAADRVAARAPSDADAWERVGRLRLRLLQSEAARSALETARRLQPSVEGLLDLALAYHLTGDVGGEVAATEQAVGLDRDNAGAWSRHAHALARTDRISEGIE